MTKLQRFFFSLGMILALFIAFAISAFCVLGTIADLGTTELGHWPYVSPELDTQKFRTNLTVLLAFAFGILVHVFWRLNEKLGAFIGRFIK